MSRQHFGARSMEGLILHVRALIACASLLLLTGKADAASLAPADVHALQMLERQVMPLPGPQVAKTSATLAERMAEAKVPAVSIAFIEDGRIKWSRAYGTRTAGLTADVDAQTRFQAASLSKALTAAAALRLVDAGLFKLDGDVRPGLTEWRVAEAISLRQLLSHTAGLSVGGYPGYRIGDPVATLVESLSGKPPSNTAAVRQFAPPGKQMAYSGGGYSVAQLFMSKAAGQPFDKLMSRSVLRPAAMSRSSFEQPLSMSGKNRAAGHDEEGRPINGGHHLYPELAAAGLWTTPSDYARFLIALQDSWRGKRGALLRPDSARAMMTPVLVNYGLGVRAGQSAGRSFITHGGSNAGFQCRFVAFLDGSRQGLVIMTNGDNGGRLAAAIQRTVAQAYGWPDLQLPPTARAPDD
jgi:CubicO group peptidase (beta-lactamase class C family)